jgi:hypothetical protein
MLAELKPIRRRKVLISTVDISVDGARYLWAGGNPYDDCYVYVCDVATDTILFTLSGHRVSVLFARFLPDNSIGVSAAVLRLQPKRTTDCGGRGLDRSWTPRLKGKLRNSRVGYALWRGAGPASRTHRPCP